MKNIRRFLSKYRLQLSIVLILALIWIIFIAGSPRAFLNFPIYAAFMTTIPFFLIMALSSTFVVISGEIDLSFPSIMGMAGFIFTFVFTATGNIYLSFLTGLVFGVFAGYLNGVLRVKIGIPSLVATIGTMFIWKGLPVILSEGQGSSLLKTRGTEFTIVGTTFREIMVGRIADTIPSQFVWCLAIAIILGFILNRHKFGAYTLYIGDNIESARMMGIKVDNTKIFIFMLNGLFAAFAGVLMVMELAFYWPTQGAGYLLITLSAIFVGGTSVFGGSGTIFGTFIGALIVGSLGAGIVAIGLADFWTEMVYGLIIVISTAIYAYLGKVRKLG